MQNAEMRVLRNSLLMQGGVGEGGMGGKGFILAGSGAAPPRPRGTPGKAALNRGDPALGAGRAAVRPPQGRVRGRGRETKPKASPQVPRRGERSPVRPRRAHLELVLSRARTAGTDLCAKPWAAATGSTFRAGSAPGAARRARPGRGARLWRRRCGGPGSRAPTADAAAARSRGHPCRALAPARRRLPGAAWPGPGGSEARGRRGGGGVWGHRRRRRGRSARRRTGLLGGRPRAEPAAAVRVHRLRRQAEDTR